MTPFLPMRVPICVNLYHYTNKYLVKTPGKKLTYNTPPPSPRLPEIVNLCTTLNNLVQFQTP